MDGNKDEQRGKQGENPLAENHERGKTKDYPAILRPKFTKKKKKRRSTSKETIDEGCPSAEKLEDDDSVDEGEVRKELKVKVKGKKKSGKEEEEDEYRGGEHTESLDEVGGYSRERLSKEVVEEEGEVKAKSKAPKNRNAERLSKEMVDEKPEPRKNRLSKERVDEEEKPAPQKKKTILNFSRERIEPEPAVKKSLKNSGGEKDKEKQKPKPIIVRKSPQEKKIQAPSKKLVRKSRKDTSRSPSPSNSSSAKQLRHKMTPSIKVKKKKKLGFREYFVRKFLRRKSDCVAQPTKEMLVKPVVRPEYDVHNPIEFSPDVRPLFNEEEWRARLRNSRAKKEEIFLNARPFWLLRTTDDVVQRCRMIEASEYLTQKSTSAPILLKPAPRRHKYYDPRVDAVEKMIAVDGGDEARLRSNTIRAVLAVQAHRKTQEAKKKKKDDTDSEDKYSSPSNSGRKVTFVHPNRPDLLHLYNRKERPAAIGRGRTFTQVEYTDGHKGLRRKPATKHF